MDFSTAVTIAIVVLLETAGPLDIGPDVGFRQTRPGADDARNVRS